MHNLYSAFEFLDGSGRCLISRGTGSRGKHRENSNLKIFVVYSSQSIKVVLTENEVCLSICMHKILVVCTC